MKINAILLCVICILINTSEYVCADTTYRIIDLGINMRARGINESGQVVGKNVSKGFLWDSEEGLTELPSEAFEINNSKQVSGGFGIWEDGSTTNLGGLAWSINESGETVGRNYIQNIGDRAFVWDAVNGKQYLTDTLPSDSQWYCLNDAFDINEKGQVVGYGSIINNPWPYDGHRAFLWDPIDGVTDLGTIDGTGSSFGIGINNLGQVVGESTTISFPAEQPFFWESNSGMIPILSPDSPYYGGYANSINDFGLVVGAVMDYSGQHAFIWDQTNGLKQLDGLLINNTGWNLIYAFDINNKGQIVGSGTLFGEQHAFLMTPIPAPGAIVLGSIGIGFINLLRRKKTI